MVPCAPGTTTWLRAWLVCGVGCLLAATAAADELAAIERGYAYLTTKPYLPADFDQEIFDALWTVWPTELQQQAASATPQQRRDMAFRRYGLSARPDDPSKPLQYVVDEAGNWTMNCFACHGGSLQAKSFPGLPNADFALATLTADVRKVKVRQQKPPARMDIGSLMMPLGTTNGTTNAVMFGVALLGLRNADLTPATSPQVPKLVHHDMDAPLGGIFTRRRGSTPTDLLRSRDIAR